MQGLQRFISSMHRASPYDSDQFHYHFDQFGNGKDKNSRRIEAYTLTCFRVSTVILVLTVAVFTLSRMLVPPNANAVAWLESGEPVWNLSPASDDGPPKQFFLDLGSSAKAMRSTTLSQRVRHLESKGFNGVCSVPLPGDMGDRTCRLLALPVAGEDYEKVTVPDCGPSRSPPSRLLQKILYGPPLCPEVTLPAVGISTVLERVDAPKVIDMVSLQTGTSELSILTNFPFSRHCVKAWTVRHNRDSALKHAIQTILEVSHGCKITDGGADSFARCPCKDGAQAQADDDAAGGASEDSPLEDSDPQQGSTSLRGLA